MVFRSLRRGLSTSLMNLLYILSESESDCFFYESYLRKITGKPFNAHYFSPPKGPDGLAGVRKFLRPFIQKYQHVGGFDEAFFLVAVDNDRSPVHPDHESKNDFARLPKADRSKSCRYCEINRGIEFVLGTDRSAWSIQGAIAVPVEMKESWQLLSCDAAKYEAEHSLPIFSEKRYTSAKHYYGAKNTKPQLKDLVFRERTKLGLTLSEFSEYCAERLDLDDLSARSPSFARFVEQVADW